jgi:hypothetical protein
MIKSFAFVKMVDMKTAQWVYNNSIIVYNNIDCFPITLTAVLQIFVTLLVQKCRRE